MYLYKPRIYPHRYPLNTDTPPELLCEPVDQPLHFPSLSHDGELYRWGDVLSGRKVQFVSPKCPVQDIDLIFWEETNKALDTPDAFLR
jgi:hypothetical protein